MAVRLLDANALIALAWAHHEHHARLKRWFADNAGLGWATCPITQLGFVRISSNPRALVGAITMSHAIQSVRRMCAHPNHEFWPDDISLADDSVASLPSIFGHQQVTDAYLIALARHHGGRLVTLDRAAAKLGCGDVELLGS